MFEMNSLSKLAIRYHDKSVLEQHHAATAISILQEDDSNILVNLSEEQFRKFRKLMISNILSTDITEHFKMVKEFETRLKERNIGQSEEDVKLVSGFIIHTSDFAGAVKSFPVSREWSTKVNLEFSAQY
jgi:calcium/calmodulin-dependent 3',5'-cyclic nucleotide phosphodiesterase